MIACHNKLIKLNCTQDAFLDVFFKYTESQMFESQIILNVFGRKKSIADFGYFVLGPFPFQRKIYVLDEGYSRNESCTYIYLPQ